MIISFSMCSVQIPLGYCPRRRFYGVLQTEGCFIVTEGEARDDYVTFGMGL